MKKLILFGILAILFSVFVMNASAGVKLKISDDTDIDLGFRVQSQFRATDNDGGNTGDDVEDFRVRRADSLSRTSNRWMCPNRMPDWVTRPRRPTLLASRRSVQLPSFLSHRRKPVWVAPSRVVTVPYKRVSPETGPASAMG